MGPAFPVTFASTATPDTLTFRLQCWSTLQGFRMSGGVDALSTTAVIQRLVAVRACTKLATCRLCLCKGPALMHVSTKADQERK